MLEAKKKNLLSQIELTDKLLKETRRTKTLSLTQLVALNKKLKLESRLSTVLPRKSFRLTKKLLTTTPSRYSKIKKLNSLSLTMRAWLFLPTATKMLTSG